jgi:hypothetical protein
MPSRPCGGPASGDVPCPTGAVVQARSGSRTAARCPPCKQAHDRAHNQRRRAQDSYAEQQRRRHAVEAHVAEHGWWCLGLDGYDHQPHPSRDLTAHHLAAPGAGGSEHGVLVVICRSLNSSIGARTARR